jgi:hypothetical protein
MRQPSYESGLSLKNSPGCSDPGVLEMNENWAVGRAAYKALREAANATWRSSSLV